MEQPVVDIARMDLDALRDLCAELLATVKAQEQRIAALEATPRFGYGPPLDMEGVTAKAEPIWPHNGDPLGYPNMCCGPIATSASVCGSRCIEPAMLGETPTGRLWR